MKKFLAILMCFALVGCAGSTTPVVTLEQRTPLVLPQSPPLDVQTIKFKVVELNGKLVVVMDMSEYEKLAKNLEDIQAKLKLDQIIIDAQREYYNAGKKNP